MLDEWPLGGQLVGRDPEALQQRGVHAEPEHPHHRQQAQPAADQAQPRPRDLQHAGAGGQRRQQRQRPQHRQRRVDVGVGRAEHHAARREHDLEAVEPEADCLEREQQRAEQQQVRASAGGQAGAARGEHEAALQDVEEQRQEHGGGHQAQRPAVGEPPQRQREHEKTELAAEDRIATRERLGVDERQHGLPVDAGPQPRGDRDDRQHDRQEPSDERLDHDASRQAELVFQLPQHVGRRRAGGEGEVGPQEDEDAERDGSEERALQRQRGPEDAGVADLLEPQEVGVERHDLDDGGQRQEEDDQQDDRLRTSHPLNESRGGFADAARECGGLGAMSGPPS